MSARAKQQLQNAVLMAFTVAAGQTTTKGKAVIFSGADTDIATAGAASDLAIGIAMKTGVAADVVEVALFSHAIVQALAGTGGVTRGTKQTLVSDGFTDAAADNGAGTAVPTYGVSLESAVAGDYFALAVGTANRTTT